MRERILEMKLADLQIFEMNEPAYLATGQELKAMLLSVLRPLLLMIPLIHIFSRIWALDGILYASPTADILTTLIVAGLVWFDMRKKQKEV